MRHTCNPYTKGLEPFKINKRMRTFKGKACYLTIIKDVRYQLSLQMGHNYMQIIQRNIVL